MTAHPRIVRDVSGVAERHFDVAVVGGGIQGALCAVEAAHRNLTTLLVEAGDFGGGTSFGSLRTIHGGLRYLQWLDFARARQSARQQRWWFDRFPDLVRSRAFLMPLYGRRARSRGAFRIAAALARLAGIPRFSPGRSQRAPVVEILEPGDVARRWPGIPAAGLQGGALWYEGFMPDSQRVIVECMRWAITAGANCLNYVELAATSPAGRGRSRLDLVDHATGEAFSVSASAVVNAAGRHAEDVAQCLSGHVRELLVPTIAWNLLLDAQLPEETCLVLTPPDEEAQTYFLQPFHGRLLAGTGHAPVTPETPDSLPSATSIERMRHNLDRAYPDAHIGQAPVLRVLAGILPGVRRGSPRLAVRPRIVADVAEGGARLVHVVGVKFTEAPEVARRAVDLLTGTKTHGLGERPPAAEHWDALHPSCPMTRESLLDLVSNESVLYLEDLVERRTNAWCDDAARARVSCLVEGALRGRAATAGYIGNAYRK